MRDIRFRAWDKNNNSMWHITDLLWSESSDLYYIRGESIRHNSPLGCHKREVPERFKNIILMQYTGLKDKNGKTEIYEGDICKWYSIINDNDIDEQYIEPIEYDNGAFLFKGCALYDWFNENGSCMLEVIGNIYENGDLLK